MAPKFALGLKLHVDEDEGRAASSSAPPGREARVGMESLRLNNDGITVMTSSYNPYSFSEEGMSRADGQHYKLSEKDIRILKRIGAGASSVVFKGFLFNQNKFVAVKKINVFERDMRHQMMNDIKALCDERTTPSLISFMGAYHVPDGGQIAIVLEFMDGGSIDDVVKKVGKIPENILSKMTAKILQGLLFLHKHKHMVHRDIKPANILINLEGEPKITDFGISATINTTLAVCNTFLGTLTYMSPERLENAQYSYPADIWSLGLTLVEAATGKYPYDVKAGTFELMLQVMNEDLPFLNNSGFSPEFRDFVSSCLHKDPLRRPPAEQLLSHAFILKHQSDPVSLRDFMQCVFDPQEKLDEIAVVFAFNYYALLSAGIERLKDLAPLYADGSIMLHDGHRAVGAPAIIAKLHEVATMNAGFKIVHAVNTVDCQPLGVDGSALVHVQGSLKLTGVSGPGNQPVPFTEAFILSQISPGEYYVASQVYRLVQ